MIYKAKATLDSWVLNYRKRLLRVNVYGIFLMLFIAFGISAGSKNGLDDDARFGLSGVVVLTLFFMYAYIRSSLIFNRTVKQIEKKDSGVSIETYDFRIFGLIRLKAKAVKIDFKRLKIKQNEFPMKESKKAGPIGCYVLRSGEVDYYLLHKEFDDALLNDLMQAVNNPKQGGNPNNETVVLFQ